MKGYKGFEKGLICRGKQYAENTVFEEDNAVICKSGMHFCENPLDVLDYYELINANGDFSEYAEVEALDEVKTDDNKKFCTKKLKIGAKLSLPKFIQASVNFLFEKATAESTKKVSGDCSKLASLGDFSKLASSGDCSQLASSGNGSKLASSGNGSKLASSGDYSKLASSGDYSKLASSGDYSKLASLGNRSKLASSGDCSQLASSGNGSKIISVGNHAVICCTGNDSCAKAKKGSWITLAEWVSSEEGPYIPECVKTEFVDGERIKEDTFYKLKDGEFVEV